MIDESHISIGLFLRTWGVRNPFDDDESERSASQRSNRSRQRSNQNNANGGSNVNGNNVNQQGNDVLVPPEDSEERQETIFTGSTALALTLSGSCAVEAPYAFQKCGILWGTLLFGLMAVATQRVLYMLCVCARKTGSNSYGTVARACCGEYRAHLQTSALEIGVLMLLVVHYCALLERLSELWLQSFQAIGGPHFQYWVLLVVVLVMIPLLIPMKLQKLGYLWSAGLFNLIVFVTTVFILAMMHFYSNGDPIVTSITEDAMSSSDASHHSSRRTLWDVIDGFQTFLIFFLASFNVLPIQASLVDPTRERMETVIHRGVAMGAFSTYLVGVIGYVCILASSHPNGSIVEAIRYDSKTEEKGSFQSFSLVIHRICHSSACLSILIAFPLILIPCRNSLLEFFESIYEERHCPEISDCQEDCDTCTTRASTVTEQQNRNNAFVVVEHRAAASETSTLLPRIEENPTYDLLSSPVATSLCTLGILLWAFLGGMIIPMMDYLYTWIGPIMVYVFAYMLPCMYFLSTQRPRLGSTEKKSVRVFARVLVFLCISGVMFAIVYIVHNLPNV